MSPTASNCILAVMTLEVGMNAMLVIAVGAPWSCIEGRKDESVRSHASIWPSTRAQKSMPGRVGDHAASRT